MQAQTPSALTDGLITAGFHALSEPLRIKILEILRNKEVCVCDLCDILGITQSKLSFHLKTLKQASLVNARQQGRWIYYSINISQILMLEHYLLEFRRFDRIIPAQPCNNND
ncbi:MAG: metalloregulator ArsR/SmtB family transcription factor [Cyanobacteria bacterium P01_A01_bin.84]